MNHSTEIQSEQSPPPHPPSHLLSDYIEIAYLSAAFMLGAGSNLYAFMLLFKGYLQARRNWHQSNPVTVGFLVLKLHLNISNLLVLFVYCPTLIGWLITYSWTAGNWLCKAMRFLWMFAFHLNSNIVASIAVDRFLNVQRMLSMVRGEGRNPRSALSSVRVCTVSSSVSVSITLL